MACTVLDTILVEFTHHLSMPISEVWKSFFRHGISSTMLRSPPTSRRDVIASVEISCHCYLVMHDTLQFCEVSVKVYCILTSAANVTA